MDFWFAIDFLDFIRSIFWIFDTFSIVDFRELFLDAKDIQYPTRDVVDFFEKNVKRNEYDDIPGTNQ